MSDLPIISIVTFLPLLGVVVLLLVDPQREGLIKHLTFGVSVLTFLVSLQLYRGFQLNVPGMQFVERKPWIPGYGVQYLVGVDGISLLLVLLTTFLTAIAILSSYTAITTSVKEYMICMLLLETGMLGVFVALDLLLFYVFWEGMLIPMYFLIGVWGGPRRIYATIKFFLYTMAGGVLMLVGIISLYYLNGGRPGGEFTFDLLNIYGLELPFKTQAWLFLAFAVAFAIKVPMFPFHTWLPDAHVEAPTAGSVILAGVLLKMGTYGFLRFALPLFPEATRYFTPLFAWLAIIGILYGALVSMVQPDLKKLVAYSSVSHLGFVMLGIFALTIQGMEGAILQMINHGLSTGALFLVVGMIYERRHSRMIEDFGGLARIIPVFTAFFMIVTLSSIGLPGLNGFVGEFLILVGTFSVGGIHILYAVLATSGVILAAVYMLWMFQRVMFGTVTHDENRRLPDLTPREIAVLVPVIVFIVWIGVYPRPFLATTEASVKQLLAQVHIRYRAEDRGAESREPRAEGREDPTATAPRQARGPEQGRGGTATAKLRPGGTRGAEVPGGLVGSSARMSNVEFRTPSGYPNVEVEQSEIPWGMEPRLIDETSGPDGPRGGTTPIPTESGKAGMGPRMIEGRRHGN